MSDGEAAVEPTGEEFDRELVIVLEEGADRETRTYMIRFPLEIAIPVAIFVRPLNEASPDFKQIGAVEQGLVRELLNVPGINAVALLVFAVKVVRALNFGWHRLDGPVEETLSSHLLVERFIGPVPQRLARVPPPSRLLSDLVMPPWEETDEVEVPQPETAGRLIDDQ